jgi:hypothetical protein
VPLDPLCLIADRAEVICYLQDGFGKPFARHISTIIESKGKQNLQSPPVAAHMSSSL